VKERNEGERVEEKRETRVSYCARSPLVDGRENDNSKHSRVKAKANPNMAHTRTKIIIVIIVATLQSRSPAVHRRSPAIQTSNPISLSIQASPSYLLVCVAYKSTPLALQEPTHVRYHLPVRLCLSLSLADAAVIASPSGARIMEAVSSPSNLGTRCGVSTGTQVDPWIVRPIKGTLRDVEICLGRSVLVCESAPQSQKDKGGRTLLYGSLSVRIEVSGNRATEYAPFRQRRMGPAPNKQQHMGPPGRWLVI
jgi:hypothetical protein